MFVSEIEKVETIIIQDVEALIVKVISSIEFMLMWGMFIDVVEDRFVGIII